jgi:acetyl-CoA synthetase
MIGSTVVIYEGGPDYPHWDRWWSILERYAVTVFLTTGGALRILSRQDIELLRAHNLDMLRLILTTAEPLEVSVWRWAYEYVGTGTVPAIDSVPSKLSGRVPIIHMFIQSELGTFVTGSLPNYTFVPLVPGSVGPPMPGFNLDVVDEAGNSVRGSVGYLVVKSPWPAMPIEYPVEFAKRWVGDIYYVGDYALMDYDLNIYVIGRSDAVMKVNGYRISPGDIEAILKKIPGVRRVVVAGLPDEQKFEVPFVLIEGEVDEATIRRIIRTEIGPIADPGRVVVLKELPDMPIDELRIRLKRHLWGITDDPVIKGIIGS